MISKLNIGTNNMENVQLIKKRAQGGYRDIFPKTFLNAIRDKESGVSLTEILQGFNMYFLSHTGSRESTRLQIPSFLRREGLWITYVLYDHTVITEWYNSEKIDDESWKSDSNWRVGSNALVGDISISSDGYWVINGIVSETKAQGEQGEQGITPLLRIGDSNKLQVSYNEGKQWNDISDLIVPKFRWLQGEGTTAGTVQISMDLGKTWSNLSNPISNNLRIKKYIGINESLPTSGVEEGTIYMKGPYYAEDDALNDNPIYRMWVYAWKGDTLAWQDNGEFTSISAGIVQETGDSETEVMSQKAVTEELSELNLKISNQKGLITDIDIDNLPSGIVSFISTSIPSGLPNINYGTGATLITTRVSDNVLAQFDRQLIITTEHICSRFLYGNAWTQWEITKKMEFKQLGVISSIDVDNLPNGIISFTSAEVPNGLPDISYGDGATLITSRIHSDILTTFDRQVILTPKAFVTRVYVQSSGWLAWQIFNYQGNVFHCGQGQQYTRLRDAVDAAIKTENSKVIVHAGIYDLTEEFADELQNKSGSGIPLDNGIHILFEKGSYVKCEVDVSNEWANFHFEPFRAYGDFILENINLVCSNTRYCVHDELNGERTYHHQYINCHMEFTNEHENVNYVQCIGGGLGEHGYIEIIGGFYKSTSLYTDAYHSSVDDMQMAISYHNGIKATCDGKIIIRDVYFADKGYCRFGNYGASTIKTPIYVSGCRMYKTPLLENEIRWDDSQIQNMEIFMWNNEIVTTP